jgi:hypothetical protein
MVREVTNDAKTGLSGNQVRRVTDDGVGLKTLYQPDGQDGNTATTVEYEHTSRHTMCR